MMSPIRNDQREKQFMRAIFDATLEILRKDGYRQLTIEAIAQKAGVNQQDIYRWWPNKGAVVLEAYSEHVAQQTKPQDTQNLAKDLELFFTSLFILWKTYGDVARTMIAEVQNDLNLYEKYVIFNIQRREALHSILKKGLERNEIESDADLESLIDILYGAIWYRLLVGHAPLDQEFAHYLVDKVLKAYEP